VRIRRCLGATESSGAPERVRRGIAATFVVLLAAVALSIAIEVIRPAPAGHPAFEAALAAWGVLIAAAAACILMARFRQTRRVRDLLVASTVVALVVVDSSSLDAPAMFALRSAGASSSAPALLVASVLAAGSFLVAARTPAQRVVEPARRWSVVGVGGGLVAGAAVEVVARLLHGALTARSAQVGARVTALGAADPIVLGLLVLGALLSLLAAHELLSVPASSEAPLGEAWGRPPLAAAVPLIVLGGACLEILPVWGSTASLEPAVVMWLAASSALAFAAFRQLAVHGRLAAARSAQRDRQRIARDLHDGLCQDLAFIAAQGARIGETHGEDHPIAIAARRALAASRGALAELSASDAPTASHALRKVANELALRYGIDVEVRAQAVALAGDDRESVVRIAREAVVNAARHGHAQHVVVTLQAEADRLLLRVEDDGCGVLPTEVLREGFGMSSMRARANELGGLVHTRAREEGGMELEVVAS
jgi:signal transduction histidine kinase